MIWRGVSAQSHADVQWGLTFVRSGSWFSSASGSCEGDDGGEGIGVLASFSNESVRFLCRRRVEGGEGGGLGGRYCSCRVAAMFATWLSSLFVSGQDLAN